jgi:hypothetical protein
VYALHAEPISFSLLPLVDVGGVDGDDGEQRVRDEDVILDEQCDEVVGDGEQRVCDVAVIPDDQCVVVVGNGEQRVSDVAVIPDDQCAVVVGNGEQRVSDVAMIPDDQCDVVVGNEGCISVVEGDVIKDKEVAKQGDEPV